MTNEEFIKSISLEWEEWRDVVGYEGLYKISNFGRLVSCTKVLKSRYNALRVAPPRLCKPSTVGRYQHCSLSKNSKAKSCSVHRLVAAAFIPNPDNKPCIDHINTMTQDNRVENLRWVSHLENSNNPLTKQHQKETVFTDEHRKHISAAVKGKSRKVSEETKLLKSVTQTNNTYNMRKVCQLDMQGNLIKVWICAHEAERQTGISNAHIIACCKHKYRHRSAGGYKWEYYETLINKSKNS